MVPSLSPSDVSRLLADPSSDVRAAVASKLAAEIDNPQLTASELALAQDIIRLLAKDVEATVRRSLSLGLRYSRRLPHDVALRLARDVEDVALPILGVSDVLTDDDLVELIKGASLAKQSAIAGRPDLSEHVSDALIATAPAGAVASLMQNHSARIREASLSEALRRFPHDDAVHQSMIERDSLPVTVAEHLVAVVSDRLKHYILSHHALPADLATDIVLQTQEQTTLDISSGRTEEELDDLVHKMHAGNRLTPSLVLRAICLGNLQFFEAAMSALANVPILNARMLIHDPGQQGLDSILKASRLPPRFFAPIRVAVDVVNGTRFDGGEHDIERYRARVITRIITQFENFGQEDLDYFLDKLGDVLTVFSRAEVY